MSQLVGKTVLITRPHDQAEEWGEMFRQRGATVFLHPVIRILPPANWEPLDQAIKQIEQFHWVVFASVNGVRFFWKKWQSIGRSTEMLKPLKIAAVGQQTARELKHLGLQPSVVPGRFDAESLAQTIVGQISAGRAQRVLVCRADRGSPKLEQILSLAGMQVDSLIVYRSVDETAIKPEIADSMQRSAIDWITVTSPAIAAASVKLFGDSLQNCKIASISPKTSRRLIELGYPPSAEADRFDRFGLIEAMEKTESIQG